MKKGSTIPTVSIVVVNYNGANYIPELLEALKNLVFQNWELVFVDNNSKDDSVQTLARFSKRINLKQKIQIIKLKKNTGFAIANNHGVKLSKGEYIFFLNNDAFPSKKSLTHMLEVLEKDVFTAGVAPKIILKKFLPVKVIDSIGICIDRNYSPFNRGIGQVDLGVYNQVEEVMGLCFAACLVRKAVFVNSGGLDSKYFAYFEDVDWSIRVRKLGFRFLSSPRAVVIHVHSATTSNRAYSWKYYLIFRNYIRTVVKNAGAKNTIRIVLRLSLSLFQKMVARETSIIYRLLIFKMFLGFVFSDSWYFLIKKVHLKRKFIPAITDQYLAEFSNQEVSTFFDVISYQPVVNMKMIKELAYKKNSYEKIDEIDSKIKNFNRYYLYCTDRVEFEKQAEKFIKSVWGEKVSRATIQFVLSNIRRPLDFSSKSS